MRFASFFISVEKGRRRPSRPERSIVASAIARGLRGLAVPRLRRNDPVRRDSDMMELQKKAHDHQKPKTKKERDQKIGINYHVKK